jgi:phospho-N-acetylmuramoyl-pentapeptide-transferase
MLTAIAFSLMCGAPFIRWLRAKAIGQSIRELGPETHFSKKGTPTMGGALILSAILISTLFWSDLKNHYIWICLFVLFGTGIIGWIDDYKKVVMKNSKGLSARQKLVSQTAVALVASILLYAYRDAPAVLKFPFFKDLSLDLGVFFIPFSTLVIVGTSNAVNLTDGLDGLAVGPTITTAITFGILAYCAGNFVIAEYLQIPFVPGAGELSIFLASTGSAPASTAASRSSADSSGPAYTRPLRRSVTATRSGASPAIDALTSTRIACTRAGSSSMSGWVRTFTLAVFAGPPPSRL